jgi:hypothetical protein
LTSVVLSAGRVAGWVLVVLTTGGTAGWDLVVFFTGRVASTMDVEVILKGPT